MADTRFDAWTRRRFGLATGGLAASVLSRVGLDDAAAKKKKRKKRCRKIGRVCKPGGKRTCCGALTCNRESSEHPGQVVCCKTAGQPCSKLPQEHECCDGLTCCGPMGSEVCSDQCESDRNVKANFGSVDPADMLQRVRDLPISTWNYAADDPSIRHIGPMAQDFAALFGVGADDRHVHPLDGQGVALAAIQGLLGQLQDVQAANARLADRVEAIERRAGDA